MKIDLYEAVFDENETDGVYSISLVNKPATQETFIQLSKDEKKAEIKLATIDEEQRLLVGLVLETDALVYRKDDETKEEFNIVFREDTIKKLAHNFFIGDYHKNSTIEHSKDKIKGVTFVESWIVADPKKDKSNVYGLEYPAGSWLVAMKVDSDEVWNDYVKTGKVQGFSIDAVMKLRKVDNNKTELSMNKIVDKVKKVASDLTGLNKDKPEITIGLKLSEALDKLSRKVELKLGQIMMEGGEIIFEFDGEVLESGVKVFAVDPADPENKTAVPPNDTPYPLEDGRKMLITEEGVVAEIIPAAGEEVAEEEVAATQEAAAPKVENAQKTATNIQSILIKYQEDSELRFKAIEEQNADIAKQLEEMNKTVVEMAEEPREKAKKTPTQVDPSKLKGYALLKYNEANGLR